MPNKMRRACGFGALLLAGLLAADAVSAQTAPACAVVRKINIGVSVSPPNVVHTSPYVAKELGIFAKHCIDANIIQFDGGGSPAAKAAASQGTALVSVSDIAVGNGVKVKQIWGLAPRLPQAYAVGPEVKSAADLKGKRLSAAGGGVGSFNWIMGREVLKSAGLNPEDATFLSAATAARMAGLVANQIDAVALHPEDLYLAQQKKPGIHALVQLADLLPHYMFNAYGGSVEWIERERPLMVDTIASMIEANRIIYRDEAKVIPIMVAATGKPEDAVKFARKELIAHCIWSVNEGMTNERTQWTIDNNVANGYIKADRKPAVEQVTDMKLAGEAVEKAGGRVTIGNCKN
jgi:ABC-type nitrate/sulfonate/bicarbonate transport system substrate-binding protein